MIKRHRHCTCDAQHDAAKSLPAGRLVAKEEGKPVIGPKGLEDDWAIHGNVVDPDDCVEDEPHQDDGREKRAHKLGAKLLDQEEPRQDHNGDDDNRGCGQHIAHSQMSCQCIFSMLYLPEK